MYRIFIADDHKIVRQGLRRIIEEVKEYKVIGETGDGLQVLPLVQRLKPDTLLLDLSMPNLRGIEVLKKIRKVNKKVIIMVLTMHKNEEYAYECLVNGARAYLLKEDADKELITAIEAAKQGKITISPSFASNIISDLLLRIESSGKSHTRILTDRELEVLTFIAHGNSNKKIAEKLGINVRTVEHHRAMIMKKKGFLKTADLVRFAVQKGLVEVL